MTRTAKPSHSLEDVWTKLSVLAADVYEGFEQDNKTLIPALDLEHVYYRVPFDIIMQTLVNIEVGPVVITLTFFLFFLSFYFIPCPFIGGKRNFGSPHLGEMETPVKA